MPELRLLRDASRRTVRSREGRETPMVCQIVSTFPPDIGGVQRATKRLARGLAREGVDVVVLTRRLPGLRRFETMDGVPVHRLGLARRGKLGAVSFALHALWVIAIHLRQYSIVHVQNIDVPLLIGLVCKRLLGRSLVATIHGEAHVSAKLRNGIGRVRVRLMRSLTDAFTALSSAMVEQLTEINVSEATIYRIPNGIDTDLFRPPSGTEARDARTRLGLNLSDEVVIFVGRLIPAKRIDLLLRAWSRLDVEGRMLLLVGDGPERENLENLASDVGLKNVRFEGETKDVRRYLYAADIFVLPSEREGLSVALLEAMATGVAVVVSDLPGNRAPVDAGQSGLVFPVNDVDALADQLHSILGAPHLRERLGWLAARVVKSEYSIEAVVRSHRQLYASLLADPP